MDVKRNAWGLDDHSEVRKKGLEYRSKNPLTPEEIAEIQRLFPGWNPPEKTKTG
jgi:hypothetical protein